MTEDRYSLIFNAKYLRDCRLNGEFFVIKTRLRRSLVSGQNLLFTRYFDGGIFRVKRDKSILRFERFSVGEYFFGPNKDRLSTTMDNSPRRERLDRAIDWKSIRGRDETANYFWNSPSPLYTPPPPLRWWSRRVGKRLSPPRGGVCGTFGGSIMSYWRGLACGAAKLGHRTKLLPPLKRNYSEKFPDPLDTAHLRDIKKAINGPRSDSTVGRWYR